MKKNNNTPLIVANWKMNQTISSANILLDELLSYGIYHDSVVICPPFTLLGLVEKKLKSTPVNIGAQDCSSLSDSDGAFTGDISSRMLADIGCKYVIIGHSERRKHHLESNAEIHKKVSNAHKSGLIAILCIGEDLNERETGDYKNFIWKNLEECLPNSANSSNTIIAYEPLWAIGTGKTASLEQIGEMHEFLINKIIDLFSKSSQTFEQNTKIIYGGSVNEENAASILMLPNVSGLLVGGASLDSRKFYQIIQSINIR